jgi:hypothetical protein
VSGALKLALVICWLSPWLEAGTLRELSTRVRSPLTEPKPLGYRIGYGAPSYRSKYVESVGNVAYEYLTGTGEFMRSRCGTKAADTTVYESLVH